MGSSFTTAISLRRRCAPATQTGRHEPARSRCGIQFAALPLLVAGAPVLVIILTAFIVNLRFLIYSATVAPYFKHLPLRWKLLPRYFVTDTGFAMFMRNMR